MKCTDMKAYMRDYHKRQYELAKKENRCTRCGWQDERTRDGYTRCERCSSFEKKQYLIKIQNRR